MSIYLELKNCNSRSMASSRYPNSVPTCRVKAKVFYEERERGGGHLHD